MALLAYNSKVNTATGVSPMLAWTSREAELPIDLILPQSEESYSNLNEQVLITGKRFQLTF